MSGPEESAGETPQDAPESSSAGLADQLRPAILSVVVLTLLAGCAFPLLLFAIAAPLFPHQAGGSLIRRNGVVVGSELIGQEFTRPEYFHSRPSAAGSGYDGTASGGTNLGPNNPKLMNGAPDFAGIRQLAEAYRKRNGLLPGAPIPVDAVTRSASGLDPHITPANAELQIPRVARARGVSAEAVRRLVAIYTQGPQFSYFGAARVSVLELNLALDQLLSQSALSH
ncbi:MAG TPA: potassium-transporting ATPase subunit KdpC [Bryobacteraceae bacterium]|nr:potassium-transporting ATPase subunit KdpC [Bryobacteraceae bacterium]